MTDRLATVFAETLKLPVSVISDETSPENTMQWDSLAAMDLVTAIEEMFSVELSTREIMAMMSVGIVRLVLRKKGVQGV
jgi:acyl carrier protein